MRAAFLLGLLLLPLINIQAARCLWVSSYASGYAWEDGLEKGIYSVLNNKCEIKKFSMNTKVNKGTEFAQAQAKSAKQLIDSYQPDVVIASDDNASKYLVAPYFKNSSVPFVFCGINWTTDEYAYPYKNVTGILEIDPAGPMVETIKSDWAININNLFILNADTHTAKKSAKNLGVFFEKNGIKTESYFAQDFADWEKGFLLGQQYDVVLLMNHSGINDWDKERAKEFVYNNGKTLTVSFHKWMSPYAMVLFTKQAEEQGEWAAKMALEILKGVSPENIPITSNQRWDEYINLGLINAANIELSKKFIDRAVPTELE